MSDRVDLNTQIAKLLDDSGETLQEPGTSALPSLSVIFFADAAQNSGPLYEPLLEIASFADRAGFEAVWLPERHFHSFGGPYPNPAVIAAAVAVRTQNIRIRAGSVVLPLHHPAVVTEAWSMVDHLSNGRVDLAFASGWNPNDFIIAPQNFPRLRELWLSRAETVRSLWRGERIDFENGRGEETEISIFPRPLQDDLAVWLAVSRSDEGFKQAGAAGYNVLTMLGGIDFDELGRKIGVYRAAREAHGHRPDEGIVSLMLHTFLHEDEDYVVRTVEKPFRAYIRSSLTGHLQRLPADEQPSASEISKLVDYSFERYFRTGGLFGNSGRARSVVASAAKVGVNEIACLLDFGIAWRDLKEGMDRLAHFRRSLDPLEF